MQTKLRSYLPKQHDISEYERHNKKLSVKLQPHKQNINYSQTKFFSNCQDFLTEIASDARQEQKLLAHKRKMKALGEMQTQQKSQPDEMLLLNVMVDYFRSHQMNYCYSMIMRQKNMVSEDVVMKGQLAQILGLKDELQKDQRFNVSVLELVLRKLDCYEKVINQKRQQARDSSIQCELLMSHSQSNNVLLTEIKLQEIRNQTELRERKHFEAQLHMFKQQELLRLKEDMHKALQVKESKIAEKYEQKLRQIIHKNNQSPQSSITTSQLSQYLSQIQQLTAQNQKLKQHTTTLQKHSLSHNCLAHESVIQKLSQITQQRKQLQQKKQQFELALKNINTNVEDMAMKKNRLMNQGRSQTQQYLSQVKINKENKDYMIDKVYSTLRGFEQRIQNLSNDNAKLFDENSLLRNQLSAMKNHLQASSTRLDEDERKKRINITQIKIPTKNFSFNVTPQQIYSQTHGPEHIKTQTEQSVLSCTTEQFEDQIRQKAEQTTRINQLKLQMGLLKSKVKHMVMEFEN